MKRRIARFITFCIATMMLLAPSVSKVYAGPAAGDTYVLEYDKDEETHVSLNPDKATVKPTLSLTKLQVPVNQVKWTYTIELTVCLMAFHMSIFSARLVKEPILEVLSVILEMIWVVVV